MSRVVTTNKAYQTFTDGQKQALIELLEHMPVLQAMSASDGILVSVLYSQNLNVQDMDALQNGLRAISRIQDAARDAHIEESSQ